MELLIGMGIGYLIGALNEEYDMEAYLNENN